MTVDELGITRIGYLRQPVRSTYPALECDDGQVDETAMASAS